MNSDWVKFIYDRNAYIVNLSHVRAFTCTQNGRVMFWLPDGKVLIVIHLRTNPDAYQKILDYVEKTTGQSLSQNLRTGLVKHLEDSVIKNDDSS